MFWIVLLKKSKLINSCHGLLRKAWITQGHFYFQQRHLENRMNWFRKEILKIWFVGILLKSKKGNLKICHTASKLIHLCGLRNTVLMQNWVIIISLLTCMLYSRNLLGPLIAGSYFDYWDNKRACMKWFRHSEYIELFLKQ